MQRLFQQLAELPVPPAPPAPRFSAEVHQRLNKRLLAGQLADLAVRGFGFAMWNMAHAAGGLLKLTLTGKFEPGPDDGPRPAP
ncbi:MAG TPA: hypothetical protein VHX65_15235 [Pirellulales bacterium]|jgi:hypothetical protein|nr:hypothetical protein [Pirellulales bacterium]